MKISLEDLLDSNFRFHFDGCFRGKIFSILRQKCGDWGQVCKEAKIERRNLFGLRRGYEYRDGRKVIHYIGAKALHRIIELSSMPTSEFENNIVMIKNGVDGLEDKVRLPLCVDLVKEEFTTLSRALAEYVYTKAFEERLKNEPISLPDNFYRTDGHLNLDRKFVSNKVNDSVHELRRRGLIPECNFQNDRCELKFASIRNHKIIERTIPLGIVIDAFFAKQVGKWLGDNAYSKSSIAVVNKNWNFIEEFQDFLDHSLLQPREQIRLHIVTRNGFVPTDELLQKTSTVRVNGSQYGDYAFVTGVYNKLLRKIIFNPVIENWYAVLANSAPDVRFGFYAGLFEAEGSVEVRSKVLSWSFGFSLSYHKTQEEVVRLLEKATMLKHLLSSDGFDARVSRKIAKTAKSFTLKYDVSISRNKNRRHIDIKLFQDKILPYMKHEDKIESFVKVVENSRKNRD